MNTTISNLHLVELVILIHKQIFQGAVLRKHFKILPVFVPVKQESGGTLLGFNAVSLPPRTIRYSTGVLLLSECLKVEMQDVLLLQCQSSQAVLASPTKVLRVPVVYSDFTVYWNRNLESAVIVYKYIIITMQRGLTVLCVVLVPI